MNLEQASLAALEAARTGDLNSVGIALEARQRAIASGEAPTPLALYAGEQTAELLRDLMRQIRDDGERLRQLQSFSSLAQGLAQNVNIEARG